MKNKKIKVNKKWLKERKKRRRKEINIIFYNFHENY